MLPQPLLKAICHGLRTLTVGNLYPLSADSTSAGIGLPLLEDLYILNTESQPEIDKPQKPCQPCHSKIDRANHPQFILVGSCDSTTSHRNSTQRPCQCSIQWLCLSCRGQRSGPIQDHRCPFWLFCWKNRWPWFTWWFNHLPEPSISPKRTPMFRTLNLVCGPSSFPEGALSLKVLTHELWPLHHGDQA